MKMLELTSEIKIVIFFNQVLPKNIGVRLYKISEDKSLVMFFFCEVKSKKKTSSMSWSFDISTVLELSQSHTFES